MTIIQSIILGIVQGLTEFLPISSSGHLNLFPWVFGWQQMPDSFDVALHIGTLLAIVIYFWKDWRDLIIGGYNQTIKKQPSNNGKMFWYIVLATIPAGVLSLVLDKIVDKIIGDVI
jgi:undecaprenyl-diphosphatase